MRKILLPMIFILIVAAPGDLLAFHGHRPADKIQGPISIGYASPPIQQRLPRPLHERMLNPGRPGKPAHPSHPGGKPGRPGNGYQWFWRPVSTTTIVREVQPIIIVNTPAPAVAEPLPEPEKVWVPAVMETRTEPGYWDYSVKKRWMGDHWRFEQDFPNIWRICR